MGTFEVKGFTYECDSKSKPIKDLYIQEDSGDGTTIIRVVVDDSIFDRATKEDWDKAEESSVWPINRNLFNKAKHLLGWIPITNHNNSNLHK